MGAIAGGSLGGLGLGAGKAAVTGIKGLWNKLRNNDDIANKDKQIAELTKQLEVLTKQNAEFNYTATERRL